MAEYDVQIHKLRMCTALGNGTNSEKNTLQGVRLISDSCETIRMSAPRPQRARCTHLSSRIGFNSTMGHRPHGVLLACASVADRAAAVVINLSTVSEYAPVGRLVSLNSISSFSTAS